MLCLGEGSLPSLISWMSCKNSSCICSFPPLILITPVMVSLMCMLIPRWNQGNWAMLERWQAMEPVGGGHDKDTLGTGPQGTKAGQGMGQSSGGQQGQRAELQLWGLPARRLEVRQPFHSSPRLSSTFFRNRTPSTPPSRLARGLSVLMSDCAKGEEWRYGEEIS